MKSRQPARTGDRVGRRAPGDGSARPLPTEEGFSLIELLVTLAVLAILLNVAAPSFQDVLARLDQSARYNRLASDLHLARGEAIKRAGTVRICPRDTDDGCGTDWVDGWLVYVERGGDASDVDTGETILRSYAPVPPAGVAIAATATVLPAANGTVSGIAFDSRGRADWTLGTFVLCDSRGAEAALALIVNGAGGFRSASASDTSGEVVTDALGRAVACPS